MNSRQEEDLFALAALAQMGEATRDQVAREIGVPSLFRTLTRLEAEGRVASRTQYNATKQRHERVYAVTAEEPGADATHAV